MTQVLSSEQIKILMNDGPTETGPRTRWPSTEEKKIILEAMQNREESVTLSGGKKFSLRYGDGVPYKISNQGNHSTVYVQPANGGTAPCGWFSSKELERELERESLF
jgi:hypothetical protein